MQRKRDAYADAVIDFDPEASLGRNRYTLNMSAASRCGQSPADVSRRLIQLSLCFLARGAARMFPQRVCIEGLMLHRARALFIRQQTA
jgi:hypothetical protein